MAATERITPIKAKFDAAPDVAQPQRRFTLTRFDDIRPSSSPNFLVKGILPREGLAVVWGAPKCGKSFWTFDLLLHVALGWEYRGRRVSQGAVVYIACEGERGLGARVEAFRRAMLAESIGPVPFYLVTSRLDLAGEFNELIADIRAQVPDGNIAVIAIDTLNRSISGSESNDEDMGAYVKAADALRETFHCLVVVIHHCGLNDKRPRGHTSLTGAADAQISVQRDTAGAILVEVEFMKDGEAGATTCSTLTVVELDADEDGEPVTSCVIKPADNDTSTSPTNRPRPTGAPGRALELLVDELARRGSVPDPNDYIPAGTRCITEEEWRQACYDRDISTSDKPAAKRQAFGRAAKQLV